MKNEKIYNKWTEFINDQKYKIYFMSDEELWKKRLEDVKLYIDTNNKRPPNIDKNKQIKKLGDWLSKQLQHYKKNLMSNKQIYNKWTEFINDQKYKIYFMSDEELWEKRLEHVKLYIDSNNKRPSSTNKNKQIKKLGDWLSNQLQNYKKNLMSNEQIYKKWTEFINDQKYKIYFMSDEELWEKRLKDVKLYIDSNNKRPPKSDKNEQIKKLGDWLSNQLQNYKKKDRIMLNNEIYKKWTEFINDPIYKNYF
jgi:hypothetical protein